MPKLESVEVVLVHCKLVENDYQHESKVLFSFSFVPNKQFGQLINILPNPLTMMNTFNTELPYIEVWFTDESSKTREKENTKEIEEIYIPPEKTQKIIYDLRLF